MQRRASNAAINPGIPGRQQVKQAIDLIAPSADRAEDCRRNVVEVLDHMEVYKIRHQILTKPGTKAAKRRSDALAKALVSVEHAAKRLHDEFPWLCFEIFWRETNEAERLIDSQRLDDYGHSEFVSGVKQLRKRAGVYAKYAPARLNPPSYMAALQAFMLLRNYNPGLINRTKGGAFYKLAALLVGNKTAIGLERQCRAVCRNCGLAPRRARRTLSRR